MEYIIIIVISIILILLLKKIFSIKISNLKNYKDSEELITLSDKFPKNLELTKEILKKINNENITIKENLDSETSLYIAMTNTISISSKKNSCARIQTIAHECIHSIQNRCIHIANFVISNIYILYFFIISILTLLNIIKNPLIYLVILVIIGFIQFTIRAFLEIDAMTKAKYLAKEYLEAKEIISKEQINLLCNEYEKINKMGIPFYVWNLFTGNMIKIIIYAIIAVI